MQGRNLQMRGGAMSTNTTINFFWAYHAKYRI